MEMDLMEKLRVLRGADWKSCFKEALELIGADPASCGCDELSELSELSDMTVDDVDLEVYDLIVKCLPYNIKVYGRVGNKHYAIKIKGNGIVYIYSCSTDCKEALDQPPFRQPLFVEEKRLSTCCAARAVEIVMDLLDRMEKEQKKEKTRSTQLLEEILRHEDLELEF